MDIGFIGMGNMGQMLVTSLVQSGALQPAEIVVSNRNRDKCKTIAERLPGVRTAVTNAELAQKCTTVFLCIKPAETKAVLDDMGPYITGQHLLVTITNTIAIVALEAVSKARIAKVIPSLVHAVKEGVSLLTFGSRCTPADSALLQQLMERISTPLVVAEEQVRVASDITSCGPAFLSYVLRAFAQAARKYRPDLTEEAVGQMVRLTVEATCRYMRQTGYSFDDVIHKVSTPGGVTADGIAVLDEQLSGVWEQLIETTIQKEAVKKGKVQL